ncbi:hypothetical protein [Spiroplasma endosymbiont of Lasioglossum villosulum]|uniref:hypothetical protein n=1 Tax=Spiroplasma endosymbiont of Lasioglossum villosulum TaxID=3066320 RepID=UPI0030CAF048
MSLQTKTIIEEELRNVADLTWFTKNFIRCHQNWHHGETCKFENHFDEKDKKCFQFRTIIKKQNEDYFIYDEIIKREDKTFFLLRLYDDKRKKVWELLIYFEKNEIVQQIRHLRYKQFLNEIKNNAKLIKKESKHTTIIRTPFLEFVRTITNQKQDNITEEVQDKYWIFKRFIWKIFHGLIFFIAWGATSPIAKIIITPIISTFVVSSAIMGWLPFTIAGIVAGICYKILCECAKKLRPVMSSIVKDKYQIELEQKIEELENRSNNLEEEVQYLKDISLNSKEVIEERILNCLLQTREKNESKTFETCKKELGDCQKSEIN